MESKTKHRILGVVVVAGLAVLMYPFMLGINHSSEKSLIKSPAFPDQATQVTSAEPVDVVGMPAETAQADSPAVANIADPAPANAAPAVAADNSPVATEIPTVKNPVTSRMTDNSPKIKKLQKKIAGKSVKKLANADALEIHSRIKHQKALSAYANSPVDKNGLMDLKKAAYVIQLGSFKQKTHALRLVNKLRSMGYRAFIQSVSTSSGENTRVFVGPEHKQTSARIVATELKKEMKLQGIVISYQPFTL